MEDFTFYTMETLAPLFEVLDRCEGVEQMDKHHPEGDVLVHSLQTFKWASRETNDLDLLLAALLHDVGKVVDKHDHEKEGAKLLHDLCSVKTLWLVENHMRVCYWLNGEMRKLGKCLEMAEHPWLPELCQLVRWDKMGRNPRARTVYDKQKIMDRLNQVARAHFNKRREDTNEEDQGKVQEE